MTNRPHDFNRIAQATPTAKSPAPFSLRLTFEERALLASLAGDQPLGQYIRTELFGDAAQPRKRRTRRPVKDQEELGQVLAMLGATRLSSNINQLAHLANIGTLPVTPDTETDLQNACDAIQEALVHLWQVPSEVAGIV